jgi:hypothetical protein
MDGNAKDSSPYAHDGTAHGLTPATDRKGGVNKAYSFAGSGSSYIDTGTPMALDTLTVSAWVYPTDYDRYGAVVSNSRDCCGTYHGYELDAPTSNKRAGFRVWTASGNAVAIYSPDLPLNTWTHLAGSFDGSTLKLYVNGVLAATGSYSGVLGTPSSNLKIGQMGAVTNGYFQGSLDDVRIYNRALSADEIKSQYSSYNSQISLYKPSGGTGSGINLTSGLVGWWPFNGNAKDNTPQSNNGVVNGATLTTDRKGRSNSAYSFSSTGSCITHPAGTTLAITGPLTVSAWFYSNVATNSQYIVRSGLYTDLDFALAFQGSTQAANFSWYDGAFKQVTTSNNSTPVGAWVHLAATRDASNLVTIYVNGNAVKTGVATTPTVAAGTFSIGASAGCINQQFNGSIDDVRVYNRALSAAEVAALYNVYY